VVDAAMKLLEKKLAAKGIRDEKIETIIGRARRNLRRILNIQFEVEDLLKKKQFTAFHILTRLIDACEEILDIIVSGLVRNAVEYTPDGGKIQIQVFSKNNRPTLVIQDYGIGFTPEKLHLIFENYFTPPDSSEYTTKQPFEFNAGGRGFDLLRIKLFSERYNFTLDIDATRCRFIPADTDTCPGDIRRCRFCTTPDDCLNSGATTVTLTF
jgi:signal transduction histidine kinase